MSKTNVAVVSAFVGLALTAVAIYAAVHFHYKHFYEFLVVGLFLALRPIVGKSVGKVMYAHLYVIFILAGLIGDLEMGIRVTGLWHYDYSHLWEYVLLYTVVYPFAGLVMVQSYLIVQSKLLKPVRGRPKTPLPLQLYKFIEAGLLLVFLGVIIAVEFKPTSDNLTLFFIIATLAAVWVLSLVSRQRGHNTLVEEVHRHPLKGLLILIIATYFNAFLHEIPNTFAHQWVYTNYPLHQDRLLGVPVIVLASWPLLLLVPVAAYYYLLATRKKVDKRKITSRYKTSTRAIH